MKFKIALFTVAFLSIFFACGNENQQNPEEEIMELHNSSKKIGEEVAKMVEELSQQKNSINVQGRSLTDKENSFTIMVSSLESDFANWQVNMQEIAKMVPDEERLSLEKTLHNAVLTYKTKAEELSHTKEM